MRVVLEQLPKALVREHPPKTGLGLVHPSNPPMAAVASRCSGRSTDGSLVQGRLVPAPPAATALLSCLDAALLHTEMHQTHKESQKLI